MTNINWRINVLNQGPRLLSTARSGVTDVNEAHLFVHTVIAEALGKACDGALQDMDEKLGTLVRRHAKLQAFA